MTPGTRVLLLTAAFLICVPLGYAQDDPDEPKPINVGDFAISGSATAGFRFVDVKGYAPQYQEMFDLGKGPRLLDFNLNGVSAE